MATSNPSLYTSLHPETLKALQVFARHRGVPVSKCVYDAVCSQFAAPLAEHMPDGLVSERNQRWHVPAGLKAAIEADAGRRNVAVAHWVRSAITRWVVESIELERARRGMPAYPVSG